jgi:hypothetical protein
MEIGGDKVPLMVFAGFLIFVMALVAFSIVQRMELNGRLKRIFNRMTRGEGFTDVKDDDGEKARVRSLYDSARFAAGYSNLRSFSLCIKRKEPWGEVYLYQGVTGTASQRGSGMRESLGLIVSLDLPLKGRMFLRPRMEGMAETLAEGLINLLINMMGSVTRDPFPAINSKYASYLLNMTGQEGQRAITPRVQEILLQAKGKYPLDEKSTESPGINLGRNALLIEGRITGEEKEIHSLVELGSRLGKELSGRNEDAGAGSISTQEDGDEIIRFDG